MTCTTRRPRVQHAYFPHFGNIINEVLNTPVQQVVKNTGKNVTTPSVNIKSTDDGYTLQLAVPGHTKKDISITVDNDTLIIKSAKEAGTSVGEFRLREFNYAGFERKFTLSEEVDKGKISASFTNGILTLDIQKKEEAKPQPAQTIDIK